MNLFKKSVKSICSIATIAVIGASMLAFPASAAVKGSLNFSHGVDPSAKKTFGKVVSTAYENNMSVDGYVRFTTGANAGKELAFITPYSYNKNSFTNTINVGAVKGSSLFKYYVDSGLRHTSTAWWNFDFR